MRVCWTSTAWEDYLYWQSIDKKKLNRINELIKATLREPFIGIGNPEPLKHDLQGFWSRRIDSEHRLVYSFEDGNLEIIACRYHY
ncbi:MAG: Txe/YoeB family addiction module toxin [Bacteroidetes bacterium]|nr:MAG: Txe/YoeB family addiction module toxin [Bacteroidota bacterium]